MVISQKLSKKDPQLLWNTVTKLALITLLPHSDDRSEALRGDIWVLALMIPRGDISILALMLPRGDIWVLALMIPQGDISVLALMFPRRDIWVSNTKHVQLLIRPLV